MSALNSVSFHASPSEEVSVTIPRAFDVNGKFYDLHIVAKDATGALVSLKDKVSAFQRSFLDHMAQCLQYCAQKDGGALSEYTVTHTRGQACVERNHIPVANAAVAQIQTRMTEVLQTVQRIAQTPLHDLRAPQPPQIPVRSTGSSASSTTLSRLPHLIGARGASAITQALPPPIGSAPTASPAPKKGWSKKAKAAAVAVAGTAALAGAAYLHPPLAASLASTSTSLATTVHHYGAPVVAGVTDLASRAWNNAPTIAGTVSAVQGAWNAVSSRFSSSAAAPITPSTIAG